MHSLRPSHRHTTGLTRREVVQVGYSALTGIGLPSVLAHQSKATSPPVGARSETALQQGKTALQQGPGGRARTVVFVYLTGAPSHIDTFDPKPEAPAEIRGSFGTVATTVPGVRFCEHLPRVAARAHHLAVIRTMTQGEIDHERGSHTILTGTDKLPPGATNLATRRDWPCFASGLDYLRPRQDGIPNGALLPVRLGGASAYSGQYAGLLGAKHDPWLVPFDLNNPMAGVQEEGLPLGLRVDRLTDRRALLSQIDRQQSGLARLAQQQQFNEFQQSALATLTAGRLTTAFALDREPLQVRERYGRHLFGQSLLLARRVVEAGVPLIQVNLGGTNWWDTHTKNCQSLKGFLLPPLDQAFSAFLDDLLARGLLGETLVILTGEFGRTPKLGGNIGTPSFDPEGRDHWAPAFSSVFAGGGVRGGQVIGKTDRIGAFPLTRSYLPSDLGATIYSTLGVNPHSMVQDRQGRPLQLNHGDVIAPLYTGADG